MEYHEEWRRRVIDFLDRGDILVPGEDLTVEDVRELPRELQGNTLAGVYQVIP